MASSTTTIMASVSEIRAIDPNLIPFGSRVEVNQTLATRSNDQGEVASENGKCTCCPFGFHIDLDFVGFCSDVEAGSTLSHLKRIQRTKRQLRKSMEIMLDEQGSTHKVATSTPPDVVSLTEAGRLLHMIDFERSATRHILHQIDSSVSTATATLRDGVLGGNVGYDSEGSGKFSVEHGEALTLCAGPEHRNTSPPVMFRTESTNSLSSASTGSSETPDSYQVMEHSRQQRQYSRSERTSTRIVTNPVLEMATAEMKPSVAEAATSEREHPVLEMATAEMKHYSATSSAQLAESVHEHDDDSYSHVDTQKITTTYHTSRPQTDEQTHRSLQELLSQYQQRIQVLQKQVETIPILQVRISVLKEEKRLLNLQLRASKSSNALVTSPSRDTHERWSETTVIESDRVYAKPEIERTQHERPSWVSVGVGDHSVVEPYKLQPDLHVGFTIQENQTDFEIFSRTVLEQERSVRTASASGLLHQVSNGGQGWPITQQGTHGFNKSLFSIDQSNERSSPIKMTRSVGVGEGNVFENSGVNVHEKEMRTIIIGQKHAVTRRNVGIECRVPTRDVGVAFSCEDEKPETRTVGVNVSYDTSGILTSFDFKGEAELRVALQGVLHRNVKSVGTSCRLDLSTSEKGILTDSFSGVSVGCGGDENRVDVEVRTIVQRKSVAVAVKPDIASKYASTVADWILDASTNTYQTDTYDKSIMTDKLKQTFVSTNTEPTLVRFASNQTEQNVFIRLDKIKHAAINTDSPTTYSTGMSTDITPTFSSSTNTEGAIYTTATQDTAHKMTYNTSRQETDHKTAVSMNTEGTSLKKYTHKDSRKFNETIDAKNISSTEITDKSSQQEEMTHINTSSFHNKSEYTRKSSKFSDVNTQYSSLEISSRGRPLNRRHIGSKGTQSLTHEQTRNEGDAPAKPDDQFSETIVERYVLTKDGQKLVSEEKITSTSSGVERHFQDYTHEALEPLQSPGTFTGCSINSKGDTKSESGTKSEGDTKSEGGTKSRGSIKSDDSITEENYIVGSIDFSKSKGLTDKDYSIIRGQNTAQKVQQSTKIPCNHYKTVHNLAALSSIIESDSAERTSEIQYTEVGEELSRKESALDTSSKTKMMGMQETRNSVQESESVEDSLYDSDKSHMFKQSVSCRSEESEIVDQRFLLSASLSSSSEKTTSSSSEVRQYLTFDKYETGKGNATVGETERRDATLLEAERRLVADPHGELATRDDVSTLGSVSSSAAYSSSVLSSRDHRSHSFMSCTRDKNVPLEEVAISFREAGLAAGNSGGVQRSSVEEWREESSKTLPTSSVESPEISSAGSVESSKTSLVDSVESSKTSLAGNVESSKTSIVAPSIIYTTSMVESSETFVTRCEESQKTEPRQLKSIMKHTTQLQISGYKKGIRFADSVTGGTGSSSDDDDNDDDNDEYKKDEDRMSDFVTVFDESWLDEGEEKVEVTDLCKSVETVNQDLSRIKISDQNIPEIYELSEEVKNACTVMADYLIDSTTIQSKQLNANRSIIQQEWFQVSSHKTSIAHHVEDFLSSVNEISRKLLEYVINMVDANGNTAIHYAISHGNLEIVSLLLDSELCDINTRNNAGYTPIMLAGLARMEDIHEQEVIRRLLNLGDINARAATTRQTALMLATSHGRTAMVKMLVEGGADVNLQDEDGSTALMCACEHGHLDIVNFLLLQPDIDADLTDNEQCTALNIAMNAGHKDVGVVLYKYLNFSKLPSPTHHKKKKGLSSPTLSNFGL